MPRMTTARCPSASAAFVILFAAATCAAVQAADNSSPKVDFSYAFATPHRITVGRPDASDRTLLDLQPGSLRMAWTYDNLSMPNYPPLAFRTPPTLWSIQITPQIDGKPLARSRWTRLDGVLPALENVYEDAPGSVRLEVLGGMTAALVRIEMANTRLEAAPVRPALRFGQLGRESRLGRCDAERGRQPRGRLERAGRPRADPRPRRRCLFAPSRRPCRRDRRTWSSSGT